MPELALVEVFEGGVPLRKIGLGVALRLKVFERGHGERQSGRQQTDGRTDRQKEGLQERWIDRRKKKKEKKKKKRRKGSV